MSQFTHPFLYLRESVFQKSISSSFEENFGIISVSMANKSGEERNKSEHNVQEERRGLLQSIKSVGWCMNILECITAAQTLLLKSQTYFFSASSKTLLDLIINDLHNSWELSIKKGSQQNPTNPEERNKLPEFEQNIIKN